MVSNEMKCELNFSPRNHTYIIQFKPPKEWFFKKQGFYKEIKNNKSKNYLIKYAIDYCKTQCSRLIIYNSSGSIQDVLSYNNRNLLED